MISFLDYPEPPREEPTPSMTTSNSIPLGTRRVFGRPAATEPKDAPLIEARDTPSTETKDAPATEAWAATSTETKDAPSASLSVETTPLMPSESSADTDGMSEPGEIRQTPPPASVHTSKDAGWGDSTASNGLQDSSAGGWGSYEPSNSSAVPYVSAAW